MIFFPNTLQLTRLCCILNHPAYELPLKRKENENRSANSTSLIAWIKINDLSLHKYMYLNCCFAHIWFFFPDKMNIQMVSFVKLDITKWSILYMMVSSITYYQFYGHNALWNKTNEFFTLYIDVHLNKNKIIIYKL